jgi:hypothetical protein
MEQNMRSAASFACRIALTLLALGLVESVHAATFFDDFNRADSPDLGPNWITVVPKMQVLGNQAVNGGTTNGYATVIPFTAPYTDQTLSLDVFSDNGSGYAGVVLGVGTRDAMVVLASDAGIFEAYGVYLGNHEVTVATGLIPSNTTKAHMTVWFSSSNVANLALDTNFDGINEFDSVIGVIADTSGFGDRVGLAISGDVRTDNYIAKAIVPEPASVVSLGLGALALVRRRRRH